VDSILDLFCSEAVKGGVAVVALLIVVFAFIGGLFWLLKNLGTSVGIKIVGALEQPSAALTLQAQALAKQSGSLDRLTEVFQAYTDRDRGEHREILILLKMIAAKVSHFEEGKDAA